MCKEYLYEMACHDAGCRWRGATSTCTRQCHEFGGAVKPGTPASKVECTSASVGCRVITHPTNPSVWKCGKQCNEFGIEQNCILAGYGTCRWASADITGGAAMCTKACHSITDADWCTSVHCVWLPATGTCRKKCIEFQMQGPCESAGCDWVTPPDYALSQCIPPATTFVNMTHGVNDTYSAEGKTFKMPHFANSSKGKQFMKLAKKH